MIGSNGPEIGWIATMGSYNGYNDKVGVVTAVRNGGKEVDVMTCMVGTRAVITTDTYTLRKHGRYVLKGRGLKDYFSEAGLWNPDTAKKQMHSSLHAEVEARLAQLARVVAA